MLRDRCQLRIVLLCCFVQSILVEKIEEVRCTSDENCGTGQRCDKLCSWTHPYAKHVVCSLICVEESPTFNQSLSSQGYHRTTHDGDAAESMVNSTVGKNNTTVGRSRVQKVPLIFIVMTNDVNEEEEDNSTTSSIAPVQSSQKGFTDEEMAPLSLQTLQKQLDLESYANGASFRLPEASPSFNVSLTTSEPVENMTEMEVATQIISWPVVIPQSDYGDTELNSNFTSKLEIQDQAYINGTNEKETDGAANESELSGVNENSENNQIEETGSVRSSPVLEFVAAAAEPGELIMERGHIHRHINESECPPPTVCGEECGITVDGNGCQMCECIWRTTDCAEDEDCKDKTKFCDLGKCQCRSGFVQDMQHSGLCTVASTDIADGLLQSSTTMADATAQVLQPTAATTIQDDNYPLKKAQDRQPELARDRRRPRSVEKPERMERLQWPGN